MPTSFSLLSFLAISEEIRIATGPDEMKWHLSFSVSCRYVSEEPSTSGKPDGDRDVLRPSQWLYAENSGKQKSVGCLDDDSMHIRPSILTIQATDGRLWRLGDVAIFEWWMRRRRVLQSLQLTIVEKPSRILRAVLSCLFSPFKAKCIFLEHKT